MGNPIYNAAMGARARIRREQLGLRKSELAVILDIGTTRLSQLEQCGVDGIGLATRWANALGIDPQDLIFGSDELDITLGLRPVPAKKTTKKTAKKGSKK